MGGSFGKRSLSGKDEDVAVRRRGDLPLNRIPDAVGAVDLLRRAGCSEDVIRHAQEVARLALGIAGGLCVETDRQLIEAGALLHDIGRSSTSTLRHVTEGVRMAQELDLDEALVRIIERHVGAGLTASEAAEAGLPRKDHLPETLEEKVVAYADNLVVGGRSVSFYESLERFRERLGEDHPAFHRMAQLHRELDALKRSPESPIK